jgi:hypothetical protein
VVCAGVPAAPAPARERDPGSDMARARGQI